VFRVIPIILLLALLFYGTAWLRKQPPSKQRKMLLKGLLWLLLGVLVLLVVTGRIHWIGAVLAALIPISKGLINLAIKFLPFLHHYRKTKTPPPNTGGGNISLDEALLTLGVKDAYHAGTLTQQQVKTAHKQLMQKLHPDRGGNDYLAARINAAKTCVLQALPNR